MPLEKKSSSHCANTFDLFIFGIRSNEQLGPEYVHTLIEIILRIFPCENYDWPNNGVKFALMYNYLLNFSCENYYWPNNGVKLVLMYNTF